MSGRTRARAGSLGQHFLGSERTAARLVADAGVDREMRVVDLGAGTGVITGALAVQAGSVLAVEIDPGLAAGLARRFDRAPNVTVIRGDACAVPLPLNPYRVVANPPFARTAAILRRLLDDPAGGLVRADLVVQWQVARHRARVGEGGPPDLLGAIWAPWWTFARGRRLPAAGFHPRPGVDAAVLVITARPSPRLAPADFARYKAFVTANWTAGWAGRTEPVDWAARFRARR